MQFTSNVLETSVARVANVLVTWISKTKCIGSKLSEAVTVKRRQTASTDDFIKTGWPDLGQASFEVLRTCCYARQLERMQRRKSVCFREATSELMDVFSCFLCFFLFQSNVCLPVRNTKSHEESVRSTTYLVDCLKLYNKRDFILHAQFWILSFLFTGQLGAVISTSDVFRFILLTYYLLQIFILLTRCCLLTRNVSQTPPKTDEFLCRFHECGSQPSVGRFVLSDSRPLAGG